MNFFRQLTIGIFVLALAGGCASSDVNEERPIEPEQSLAGGVDSEPLPPIEEVAPPPVEPVKKVEEAVKAPSHKAVKKSKTKKGAKGKGKKAKKGKTKKHVEP